jgi:hypothetical protein
MRHKYGPRSEFISRDPSISNALNQVVNVIFDRHQRKKKRHHHYYNQQQQSDEYIQQYPYSQYQDEEKENDENQQYRKCSNSLCQMIENDVSYLKFLHSSRNTFVLFLSLRKSTFKIVLIVISYHIVVNTVVKFIGLLIIIYLVGRSIMMDRKKIQLYYV